MADVKWIKITTNMFDDEKIKLIEALPDKDAILIIWVKLLVQAGKCNASGYLLLNQNFPYTDEMLSTVFNRPLNTVRMALETFKNFGMIDFADNSFCISNWEKHQNVEGLEKIREQNRERKQRQRLNQKDNLKIEKKSRDSHVTVTQSHATDLELDIDKEKKIPFCPESDEARLTNYLFQKMRENNPSCKEPNLHKWAEHIEKLIRIDKKQVDEIKMVIDWCQQDDFWKSNILSTEKLRKKFDQLILKAKIIDKPLEKKTKTSTPSRYQSVEDYEYER